MKLSECLAKNYTTIGPSCNHLGKSQGSFLGRKKVMLSHSDKNGWGIRRLNLGQLFLRKVFGAYSSTHLNHVNKKINKIELSDDIKVCHGRIQTIWTKHKVVGKGNAHLSKAEVICFAEKHCDHSFRASIAQLINANYRKGDIVLVEGLVAPKEIKPNDHPQTEHVNPDCIVRGWEPHNFLSISGDPFAAADAKYKEIGACSQEFIKNLPMKGKFTDDDYILAKQKLDVASVKIKQLNEFYQSDSPRVLTADNIFNEVLEKIKSGKINSDNDGELLYAILLNILAEFEKKQEKMLYKNITPEMVKKVRAGVEPRNASLVAEINKYRAEGRRVFVIAGAAHLLHIPWHKNCRGVKAALRKNKFAVVTRKSQFSWKVAWLNRELKSVKVMN